MIKLDRDPFKEYMKETEPNKRYKGYAWHTAIGLQAVDGLKTSEYLLHTAIRNIEGEISFEEANALLQNYYEENPTRDATNRTTVSNILKLREAFPGQTIFGRSDVMKVIDIKASRASDFLKDMVEHGVIEPVTGHGKGKYRFR